MSWFGIEMIPLLFYAAIFLYSPFLFDWMERKVRARVQLRYGPKYNSPFGFFQPLYDFAKLLKKEDLNPKSAGNLFRVIPYFRIPVLLLPFFYWVIDFRYSILVLVAVVVIDSMLIWIAGFVQKNRFAVIGASRNVIQRISFEIPLFILLITPSIVTGTYNVIQPFNILFIIPFALSIIPVLAELEMIPFDIPRAGSEIISGWKTEYSGKKLAILKYGHNMKYVLLSLLISTVFLGPGLVVVKTMIVGLILAFVNSVFARYKLSDVVSGAWRYLIPLSVLQLVVIWTSSWLL
jgi:NADH-quinone oxidoreductase subunit H